MAKKYTCIIQEGQAAEREQVGLEAALRTLGEERFGDDPASTEVDWVVMKKGWAWTAGEPSTSSLVVRSVSRSAWDDDEREKFLRTRSATSGSKRTGCHDQRESSSTAFDGPLPL